MSSIAQVAAPYRAILCDIWGVVHDGARLLPGAAERLLAWKADGKRIILLTNAPRPASTVQRDLDRIGLILGVDRFLDMCRTTLNVVGDLVAAQVISALSASEAPAPSP